MDFKFRAVDHHEHPPTTSSHSLSPATYISDRSLQMDASFSGLRMPLSGEAALRRELEKEVIRREILRRSELEEEVRRELAMERELGISIHRPLNMNIQGLMSHWSNSTLMNPAAVAHIGASQPPSILPPSEINHFREISDKTKVILLDKPDPNLFNAKRKATTPPESEIEPLAFSLKKKLNEEWSCSLCEIKATSESGLNAHLNGKKHKAREAGRNRKVAKRNKKSGKNVMVAERVVTTTKLVVDAEKDQQLLQPCTALDAMNETAVDKGVEENEKEEQLVKTVADNDASATESKTEKFVAMMVGKNTNELKNEEQLVETMADNSVMWKVKPINENELVEAGETDITTTKLGVDSEKDQQLLQHCTTLDVMNETVVDKGVTESKKEEQLVKTVADNDTNETKSKNEKNESESKIEEQLGEIVADNGVSVIKSSDENELVEMMVDNDEIKLENGRLFVEKSQTVGSLESKKDAAIEEAEKISALTKRRKVEPLWCEICQIKTFSKAVMEVHIKGKKHIKKMRKFGQINVSPPSTLSVTQKAPMIKDT